jgi:hypothetical protein
VPGLRIFTKSDVASMEHNFYFYVFLREYILSMIVCRQAGHLFVVDLYEHM